MKWCRSQWKNDMSVERHCEGVSGVQRENGDFASRRSVQSNPFISTEFQPRMKDDSKYKPPVFMTHPRPVSLTRPPPVSLTRPRPVSSTCPPPVSTTRPPPVSMTHHYLVSMTHPYLVSSTRPLSRPYPNDTTRPCEQPVAVCSRWRFSTSEVNVER